MEPTGVLRTEVLNSLQGYDIVEFNEAETDYLILLVEKDMMTNG